MFKFKQFDIRQERSSMKVNTDGILLGAWADSCNAKTILDVGCGNGLIALMLAQRNPLAHLFGVEIDEGSYLDAVDNFQGSPFKERLQVELDSVQHYASLTSARFDHIVSNPPFFTGGTFSPNVNKLNVRHTTQLPHDELLQAVKKLLAEAGQFSVILPVTEGLQFVSLAKKVNLFVCRKCEVYTRRNNSPERLLITFSQEDHGPLIPEKLIIHEGESNAYSADYITLTKDFYLNM